MKKNKSESELLTDQFNNELRSMNFHKVINYALTGYIYTKMFHKNENQKWDVDHVRRPRRGRSRQRGYVVSRGGIRL